MPLGGIKDRLLALIAGEHDAVRPGLNHGLRPQGDERVARHVLAALYALQQHTSSQRAQLVERGNGGVEVRWHLAHQGRRHRRVIVVDSHVVPPVCHTGAAGEYKKLPVPRRAKL